jgi:hypothetical protein
MHKTKVKLCLGTPSEEQRLKVFENRVLRKTFEHERKEVTGDGRKLHIEELHDLYSPNIIWFNQMKKNEMGKVCVTCGEASRKKTSWKTYV